EVHHDERRVGDAKVDHRDAVRVVEAAHGARLELEALGEVGREGERRMQELHRHDAAQALALGAVHHAHGAGGEAVQDLVAIREGREVALARAGQLADEGKSKNDALELLRTSSGDLGSKLTTCKDELTTQTASFDDADKKRTVLEADLTVCQSSVKDLKEQSK